MGGADLARGRGARPRRRARRARPTNGISPRRAARATPCSSSALSPWLEAREGDCFVASHGGVARAFMVTSRRRRPRAEAENADIWQGRALIFERGGYRGWGRGIAARFYAAIASRRPTSSRRAARSWAKMRMPSASFSVAIASSLSIQRKRFSSMATRAGRGPGASRSTSRRASGLRRGRVRRAIAAKSSADRSPRALRFRRRCGTRRPSRPWRRHRSCNRRRWRAPIGRPGRSPRCRVRRRP